MNTRTATKLLILDESPCAIPRFQLPSIRSVISGYYYEKEEYLKNNAMGRVYFNDLKSTVIAKIIEIWTRASLENALIAPKRLESNLKKLLGSYEDAKKREDGTKWNAFKQKLDTLFDICSCKCPTDNATFRYNVF